MANNALAHFMGNHLDLHNYSRAAVESGSEDVIMRCRR